MAYDPDPRKKISPDFHLACLFAYSEQAHLLTDHDSDCLHTCILAYTDRGRVTRFTFAKAKKILKNLRDQS